MKNQIMFLLLLSNVHMAKQQSQCALNSFFSKEASTLG